MKNKKIIFGILGAVLLGVVTNAIWDVLKPLSIYLFKTVLNISVLGIEKIKDNIYVEIAKGMHEGLSLQVFSIIHGILLSFIFVGILMVFHIRRKIALKEGDQRTFKFFDKIDFFQKEIRPWFLWSFLFYALFVLTIFILDLTKQTYINNAVTNFNQLSKIVHPYVSEEEHIKYISDFSQIRKKEDYVNLIKRLENIANSNNQIIPEFDFTF